MTEQFERAFHIVMRLEGGYVNDPHDNGGATKYGISQARYPNLDIEELTEAKAKAIYRRDFWDAYRCGELPWPIAFLIFDGVLNHHPLRPIRWLQQAVGVTADGLLGPRTVAAAKACRDPIGVARDMTMQRIEYVKQLADYPRFGKGWHSRHVQALTEAIRGWNL